MNKNYLVGRKHEEIKLMKTKNKKNGINKQNFESNK